MVFGYTARHARRARCASRARTRMSSPFIARVIAIFCPPRARPARALCGGGGACDRSAWEIEIDNETNRSQVRRSVISLQTILEHTVVFPILLIQICIRRAGACCNVIEGAALLLSDLGVAWAVLSAAWFLGELAKPRSATARSVSSYAPVFPSWDWASRPFIHVRRLCLWNSPVRMHDM